MSLIRLNITTCIVMGDARRLKTGKAPVRNIKGLSRELEILNEDEYDADKICRVLYTMNKLGVIKVDDCLVKSIQNILLVEETELVKYPRN